MFSRILTYIFNVIKMTGIGLSYFSITMLVLNITLKSIHKTFSKNKILPVVMFSIASFLPYTGSLLKGFISIRDLLVVDIFSTFNNSFLYFRILKVRSRKGVLNLQNKTIQILYIGQISISTIIYLLSARVLL